MSLTDRELAFLKESNKIEGILRLPHAAESLAFQEFMAQKVLTVTDFITLVHAFQPGAKLRNRVGLDVRVGNYVAPRGGEGIQQTLQSLLDSVNEGIFQAYEAHVEYEKLHPFTDGNGRSGRMLWWWIIVHKQTSLDWMLDLGFLHSFYYQTLERAS